MVYGELHYFGLGFNSMEPSIYEIFQFHDSVSGLWKAMTTMDAHSQNEVRVYELYREISNASQGSETILTYYSYMTQRWEELYPEVRVYELYREISKASQGSETVLTYYSYMTQRWEEYASYRSLSDVEGLSAQAATTLQAREEKQKIYQFLTGLRSEFELPRTQIFNFTPLPPLGEVYALMEKQESRLKLTTTPSIVSDTHSGADQMAFVANTRNQFLPRHSTPSGGNALERSCLCSLWA